MSNQLHPNAQYMFKHLSNAINELVTGSEDIRKRLIYAGEHFTCIDVRAVPVHLQPLAQEIRDYLTEHNAVPGMPSPYNSAVYTTMKRRRKSTAVETAKKMWRLYHEYKEALSVQ